VAVIGQCDALLHDGGVDVVVERHDVSKDELSFFKRA
jgi:hypothetical protein